MFIRGVIYLVLRYLYDAGYIKCKGCESSASIFLLIDDIADHIDEVASSQCGDISHASS